MQPHNKIIAKNTLFLYIRMMFTMFVTLYTSRLILETLGINDYGIYQVVGGVTTLLSFLNGVMSTGSSRFLIFELGKGDFGKLKKTFDTTLTSHILLAVIIFVLAETIGLWFVCNKLDIPQERMHAALWVYQLSIITAVVNITQVPYTASIISHERMGVYAYIGIVEVLLKLAVVFLLLLSGYDKLITYAILLCVVQMGIALFYRFYCVRRFKETHFQFGIDKTIFKSVFGFSGWSLFASISTALNEQGTAIITNIFFTPAVVAARAISIQVNMTANQFVNNFRTAVNPQIVKSLAAGDVNASRSMLLLSTKFSFYLMFLLGLPIILLAEPIIKLWLVEVPEYTVIFLQLVIVQSLFSVFDTSFYTALYAKGRLKENALLSPMLGIIRFFVVYVLFKNGFSPVALSYAGIINYAILGLVVKPILICKIANYKAQDVFDIIYTCVKVCLVALPVPILLYYTCVKSLSGYIIIGLLSVCSVLVSIYCVGLETQTRRFIMTYTKHLIFNKRK